MPMLTVTVNKPPQLTRYISTTALQPQVTDQTLTIYSGVTANYSVASQLVKLSTNLFVVYVTISPKLDRSRVAAFYFERLNDGTVTRRRANHNAVKSALYSNQLQFSL